MKKGFPLIAIILSVLIAAPIFIFAQTTNFTNPGQGVGGVLSVVLNLLNTFLKLLMLFAVVFFVYGIVKYIASEDKSKAKDTIMHGLIGLFIIVAFWGIIRIVQSTFGLDDNNQIQQQDVPCIQGIGINC